MGWLRDTFSEPENDSTEVEMFGHTSLRSLEVI
ncbi:hypothetical protein Goklo_004370 [Gossypium klotzschianum]|uniref:Uncharacterized protein n=2 Tax=Gossypium klotzschianum TaxID=34286 RepID=A0A7J8VNL8_9ROSI|nr:hypothetical protein [Gossypium klotzschianum]